MNTFSHREYFQRYRLNVEQYGEILVADAFQGQKMGDAQPSYDVEVSNDSFVDTLKAIGIDARKFIVESNEKILIEVKSKLSQTKWGCASVVHCNEIKLVGKRTKKGIQLKGMTHLAIVIVNSGINSCDETGRIMNAWLLRVNKAKQMRVKPGKTQYISVRQLRDEPQSEEFFEITALLNKVADKRIETL